MSSIDRRTLLRLALPIQLAMVVMLAGSLVDAVTLQSKEGVRYYNVRTADAVGESKLLAAMIACDNDTIPLPNVSDRELNLIVRFIKAASAKTVRSVNGTEVEEDGVPQWAKNNLVKMELQAQCDLLTSANYLAMGRLMNCIASVTRPWKTISTMRNMLPVVDTFWFVVNNTPGMKLLRRLNMTGQEEEIVKEIPDLIAYGSGNISMINGSPWRTYTNILHGAVRRKLIPVVELLLHVPGINANVRDEEHLTPLHWAATVGSREVTALLLRAPDLDHDVDVDAKDRQGYTALRLANDGRHFDIVDLIEARIDQIRPRLSLKTLFTRAWKSLFSSFC
ncbi:unnamed protein product (mitochondrion) [Plasmodiophora brassicae]|uniref:Uncharacterized protein n=1 Tax=Plasmodiophora brassicae TaxID=37360 RepID=A0A3P3YMX0_PLABS|nr:unnamed protein product [Plasmodiophora brassicae]